MSRISVEEHRARLRRARTSFLVAVSLYVAYELLVTSAIHAWIGDSLLRALPASFIAGVFFTSLLSVVPATVVFFELTQTFSPFLIASLGAAGAVLGDLFLFLFVREAVRERTTLFFKESQRRRLRTLFRHPFLHWLLPLFGALIIASPVPDEFGLALMGLSRMDMRVFLPISYGMNFLGIIGVAYASYTLL